MLTCKSFVRRRRRSPSITSAPPALSNSRLALTTLALKALGYTMLPIEELVAGGTLSENLSILARTRPEIVEPGRWAGLLNCLPARTRRAIDEKARAMGLASLSDMTNKPLVVLDLIEGAAND